MYCRFLRDFCVTVEYDSWYPKFVLRIFCVLVTSQTKQDLKSKNLLQSDLCDRPIDRTELFKSLFLSLQNITREQTF